MSNDATQCPSKLRPTRQCKKQCDWIPKDAQRVNPMTNVGPPIPVTNSIRQIQFFVSPIRHNHPKATRENKKRFNRKGCTDVIKYNAIKRSPIGRLHIHFECQRCVFSFAQSYLSPRVGHNFPNLRNIHRRKAQSNQLDLMHAATPILILQHRFGSTCAVGFWPVSGGCITPQIKNHLLASVEYLLNFFAVLVFVARCLTLPLLLHRQIRQSHPDQI
jgi:hypothetical protein